MAGDWIKMRGNLWDDPRVSRLCDLTEQTEAAVIGGLYWLWATADQHTENGILPGLTPRQIDRKSGVPGLGQALCDIGWLADHPEGVRILRFEEHNGASAKKRAVTAKRVASYRSSNADVTQGALQNDDASVSGALAREREEKRREKKHPPTPQGGDELSGFANFWQAWPSGDRKQAKGKCLEAWKKAGAEPHAALVVAHVQHLKASDLWTRENGKFIPAPLVYLSQRRWEGAETTETQGEVFV